MAPERGRPPGFEPHAPHERTLPPEDVIRRKVKAELRKRMRGLRNTAPLSACEKRSAEIVRALLALPSIASATKVALFWPMTERHEVDLRALDEGLRARGVALHYPAIDPETSEMTFRRVDAVTELVPSGYGPLEPPPSAPVATALDVVVVPALAVDEAGYRIGYGRGYYDRTLPRFAPPAASVAVAFDYQLVAEIPVTEGDVPCDFVVTDARTFAARRA